MALELASASPDDHARLAELRRRLTLSQRTWEGSRPVLFYAEQDGWLMLPRGVLLGPDAGMVGAQLWDGRSQGVALPRGAHVAGATFGQPPFPAGQPQFIADIVAASQANGYGGLAEAPTRAGKTLCSIEAACRLGSSTLILVDREPLLEQWVEAVAGAPNKPGSPRVLDGLGSPVAHGVVRGDRDDGMRPFVVAMVQTIARRALTDVFRRAFGTVIVDECQSVPCDLVWSALQRMENRWTLGLTATPDRSDGLGPAIPWLVGPTIAKLHRPLAADVHFLHVPYRAAEIEKPIRDDDGNPTGETRMGKARLTRFGETDNVQAEKALMADRQRIQQVGEEAVKAAGRGRQVLVLAGLRDHIAELAAYVQARGIKPGVYIGGHSDRDEMRRPVVIASYGIASKGIDFQPPPTVLILASPRGDVRQAVGRVLQPQAPCRPLIVDVVDQVGPLIKQARKRRRFYEERAFTLRNTITPGGD